MDVRFSQPGHCFPGCTTMDLHVLAGLKKTSPDTRATIFFLDTVRTNTELEAYQFLSLLADLGGYLGLTLGLSLFDIVTQAMAQVKLHLFRSQL